MSAPQQHDAPSTGRTWQCHRRSIGIHGVERAVRLVRFETGWLASADTPSGPTIGADHSPYLAMWQALEPLDVDLVVALALVGPVARD